MMPQTSSGTAQSRAQNKPQTQMLQETFAHGKKSQKWREITAVGEYTTQHNK